MTAYEKVCTLITFMDREIRENVFMASYGENEVRFYTNELHEPKLLEVIKWNKMSLDTILETLRRVTVVIA